MEPIDKTTHLMDAIRAGDQERVANLLRGDASLLKARDPNGVSAISLAMYHGRPEIAQVFVQHGAVLDLHEAAATGDLDRVRELATPENINSASPDGFQALGLACYFGHEDIARFLLGSGADVNLAAYNAMKVCPIHAAAARRSVSLVRMLLENGADPNARQEMGYTALDTARQNGDNEMIDLLLAHGAAG